MDIAQWQFLNAGYGIVPLIVYPRGLIFYSQVTIKYLRVYDYTPGAYVSGLFFPPQFLG